MDLVAITRRSRCLLALAPLACGLATLPATAGARIEPMSVSRSGTVIGTSGGSASTTTAPPTPATSTTAPVVKLAAALTASGDGITITVAGSGTTRQPLTISGTAPATAAGGTIEIQTSPQLSQHWTSVASAPVKPGGGFSVVWVPDTSGQVEIRAVLASGSGAATAQAETGENGGGAPHTAATESTTGTTSPLVVPIFKSAVASIYGPGFWGRHTACGQRLSRSMLGVASRTLKCGTKVEIDYRGREITVPVIDRGPFGSRADWDLTLATANALGMKQPTTIGTLL